MVTINLFRNAKDVEFVQSGEVVFQQGEEHQNSMYIVQEGEVDIMLGDRLIERVGAGGVVGEMALIDDGPRSATVIARSDARLVMIDRSRFDFLVQETPNFARQVMQVLVERLRAMDRMI